MKSLLLFVCFLIAWMPVQASAAGGENEVLFAAMILAIITMIVSLKYLRIYLLTLFDTYFSLKEDHDNVKLN